ncbi:MAG: 23S rRNA (uracil(1939)-C(5))-methyltransferase RlmD [Planctomycetes bacterium]|nr:23S rRNA (uracil(1939)-C(5))-methyltransferase RlmD [Planctomycetota bacterium]
MSTFDETDELARAHPTGLDSGAEGEERERSAPSRAELDGGLDSGLESALDPMLERGERKPRWGDVLELDLERFDEKGRAEGRWREFTITVRRGVPGARVRVKVLRRRKNDVEAHLLATVVPSVHAVAARCEHVPHCGGCSLQELAYAAQLDGKARLVREAFDTAGFAGRVAIEPVLGATEPFRYRNKMEFGFGTRRWIHPDEPKDADGGFALGLHAAELFSKVIDVRSCAIQAEVADRIVSSARELALEQGLEAWDLKTHRGLLRHLAFRCTRGPTTAGGGTRAPEVLVNLVTSTESPERVGPYVAALLARHPEITTLVQNVTARAAQVAIGERELVLHGPGFVVEELGGVRFAISANSFFQTNSAQAEELFRLVREAAALTGVERVFDLYCGTGALGLALARDAREIVGFEQVSAAVLDARRNAELNGFTNARFVEGDVLDSLARLQAGSASPFVDRSSVERADVCIVDPPRAGLHPDVPARIAALGAPRVVYVSCNPRSGARDAALFEALGYALVRVQPVDLFPHTPHVESVLTLERRTA